MAFDLEVGGSKKQRVAGKPEMNVTPLVDVVLVLLIIFMVVTPLLTKQFWVHMPDLEQENQPETPPAIPDDPDDGPIVVTVTTSGAIRINRDVIPESEFQRRLTRVLAARGSRTIFFDAEDEVEFSRAATVLDLARGGGATTIAVLTEAIH
jgi:biopolymer transport protein ExbD/biopolymer transport protein TolR